MIESRFRAAAFALGVMTTLLGIATLCGWVFEIAWLVAPWAGSAPMKANTALALALAGAGLAWEARGAPPLGRPSVTRICAAAGGLMAMLTLSEYALNVDLGIDRLLVRAAGAEASQRMAPNTGVLLTMIAIALGLREPRARWLRPMTDALAPTVLVMAFVALAGYAYSASAMYGVAGFESMALTTSLGLAALSAGTLLGRPEHPLTRLLAGRDLAGASLRRSLPVLLVPFLIGHLRLEGQHAGWYGLEFGLGVMVTATTVVLGAVMFWNARVQRAAEAKLERMGRDQTFSLQLSELLGAAHGSSDALFQGAKAIGEFLAASRASFFDVDATGGRVIWHRDYGPGLRSLTGETALAAFDPSAQALARAGQRIVSADTSRDALTAERYAQTYQPLEICARVLVPLFRDEQWAGGLIVASDRPRAWQQREIDLIDLVAHRAWEWSERLRANEQLQRALEESPLGKVIIDAHGQVMYVNRRTEQLFGYPRAELIGRSVDQLVPEAARARHAQLRHDFSEAPRSRPMGAGLKLRAARRDGSEVPVEIVLTPLPDGGTVLASIADETARVRAEEAREQVLEQLERAKAELERRVAERTDELTRAVQERGLLLQEIHHRVKNNLQVVSSMLKMQARRLAAGAGRSALEECEQRIATIAVVHETLYRAADYGKLPFADYVNSLISNVFHLNAPGDRVRLETAIDPVVLTIDKAIPCGLILNELIANALKHAFPNGRSGRIRAELRELGESTLRLSVCDDGIGMPPSVGPDMESRTLGMQIVRALADQLRATLTIVRDGGTAIHVDFSTEER